MCWETELVLKGGGCQKRRSETIWLHNVLNPKFFVRKKALHPGLCWYGDCHQLAALPANVTGSSEFNFSSSLQTCSVKTQSFREHGTRGDLQDGGGEVPNGTCPSPEKSTEREDGWCGEWGTRINRFKTHVAALFCGPRPGHDMDAPVV